MKKALGSWLLGLNGKRARLAVRGVAGLAVVLSAVAGSVAQLLRIEEIAAPPTHSGRADATQYRIVWAAEWRPQNKNQEPGAKSQEPGAKRPESKQPRLLKPLADHWEAAPRVQLDSADAPAPVAQLHPLDCAEPAHQETAAAVCLSYVPPHPPARGPPL